MAQDRGDTRALLFATGTLVVAGLVIAAFMLLVTRGNGTPSAQDNGPLEIGDEQSLVSQIDEGGPLYFANPFGGDGFWVALDNKKLVAYVLKVPDRDDCNIKWQGRDDTFVDCDRTPIEVSALDHYVLTTEEEGARTRAFVDLTRSQSGSPSPSTT